MAGTRPGTVLVRRAPGGRGQPAPKETDLQKSLLGRPRGLGGNSLRGGVHTTLPGSSRGVAPPPLAASMAESRSCIHFSFSSRELRGRAKAQGWLAERGQGPSLRRPRGG